MTYDVLLCGWSYFETEPGQQTRELEQSSHSCCYFHVSKSNLLQCTPVAQLSPSYCVRTNLDIFQLQKLRHLVGFADTEDVRNDVVRRVAFVPQRLEDLVGFV